MAVAGEIANKARERIPVTWDVLASDDRYGDSFLQGRVDSVKQRLFQVIVDPVNELSTYGLLTVDYAGIQVALSVIPAGADYWASQSIQHSAVGKNEQKTFLDRVDKLWELHDRLVKDAANLLPDVELTLPIGVLKGRPKSVMTASDAIDSDDTFVTHNPFEFERPFDRPPVV